MYHHLRRYTGCFPRLLAAAWLLLCGLPLQAAPTLALETAVATALEANPGLAAIEARAQALAQLPSQAGALPDPSLSVNMVNLPLDSRSRTQEAMTQLQVGISQVLPYPGKLALSEAAAGHEAGAARADVETRRLQLVRDVKTVWWNLFYLDRVLEIIDRNQVLVRQIVNVAETRYRVGQGSQPEIHLAQLELSRLRDREIQMRAMRSGEAARLNLLLDRPAATEVVLPATTGQELPAPKATAELMQRAAELHPDLNAGELRIRAARSRYELAKKGYGPDFKVTAVYGQRDGLNPDGSARSDLGSLMLSMNLPLYAGSKQSRAVDQRNAEWLEQKHRLHERRNEVTAEVSRARSDYLGARRQVSLFRDEVLPHARQTVETMLAGYQVGKADFLSLIRSQATSYDYETQYWQALSGANQALARLVAAVGGEQVYE